MKQSAGKPSSDTRESLVYVDIQICSAIHAVMVDLKLRSGDRYRPSVRPSRPTEWLSPESAVILSVDSTNRMNDRRATTGPTDDDGRRRRKPALFSEKDWHAYHKRRE